MSRAVDSIGQTIDFLLTARRDKAAARRFFHKGFSLPAKPIPRVSKGDKNAADAADAGAMELLKRQGTLPRRVRLRPCQFLNKIVEQDHRIVKKRVRLAQG